jgi:hypothetical protein
MENMIGKKSLTILAISLSLGASAQFGLSAGPAFTKSFGAPKMLAGFHIGGEVSQDDASSYFARFSYFPGGLESTDYQVALIDNATNNFAFDPLTGFQLLTRMNSTKTNYTKLEGGIRYYLIDGYETGFSVYGGSKIVIGFNKVKADYTPYNEAKYRLTDGLAKSGTAFSLGFGLQGGLKYGIVGLGTVFFDLGVDFLLTGSNSNDVPYYSNYLYRVQDGTVVAYRQPTFTFSLGFRKDLFVR